MPQTYASGIFFNNDVRGTFSGYLHNDIISFDEYDRLCGRYNLNDKERMRFEMRDWLLERLPREM